MATLVTQNATAAGHVPSYAAATSGGDKFSPGDHVQVRVKNGGGSPITVTVVSQQLCDQGFEHDYGPVSVAAGAEEVLGPFPQTRFAAAADGLAVIHYSAVTSVTVAVERVGQ